MLSKWANEGQVGNFYCDFFVYLKSRFPACPGGLKDPHLGKRKRGKTPSLFRLPIYAGQTKGKRKNGESLSLKEKGRFKTSFWSLLEAKK